MQSAMSSTPPPVRAPKACMLSERTSDCCGVDALALPRHVAVRCQAQAAEERAIHQRVAVAHQPQLGKRPLVLQEGARGT